MTPSENLARFFPAMFADDRETLGELLAAEVVWHVPPFTLERFGDRVGRQEVLDFLCAARDEFYRPGSFSLEPEVEAVEGDRAIWLGRLHATTAKGAAYANRYAFGFRYAQGRIVEAWELLDSAHFEAQMEGAQNRPTQRRSS